MGSLKHKKSEKTHNFKASKKILRLQMGFLKLRKSKKVQIHASKASKNMWGFDLVFRLRKVIRRIFEAVNWLSWVKERLWAANDASEALKNNVGSDWALFSYTRVIGRRLTFWRFKNLF